MEASSTCNINVLLIVWMILFKLSCSFVITLNTQWTNAIEGFLNFICFQKKGGKWWNFFQKLFISKIKRKKSLPIYSAQPYDLSFCAQIYHAINVCAHLLLIGISIPFNIFCWLMLNDWARGIIFNLLVYYLPISSFSQVRFGYWSWFCGFVFFCKK